MLTRIISINRKDQRKAIPTVPNPVFGIEKVNGGALVVFSGEIVVAEGILKLKPVDGGVVVLGGLKPVGIVESLLVVVVALGKLNDGNAAVVGRGGFRIELSFPLVVELFDEF